MLHGPRRGSVSDRDRRDRRTDGNQKVARGGIDDGDHVACVLVEALAQARCRRHLGNIEGLFEEGILTSVLDGVEIALGRAQEPDVTLHAIGVRDAVAQWDRLQVAVQARVPKCPADQRQSRMRGQFSRVGLHDIEAPHVITCRVSRSRQDNYPIRNSNQTITPDQPERRH